MCIYPKYHLHTLQQVKSNKSRGQCTHEYFSPTVHTGLSQVLHTVQQVQKWISAQSNANICTFPNRAYWFTLSVALVNEKTSTFLLPYKTVTEADMWYYNINGGMGCNVGSSPVLPWIIVQHMRAKILLWEKRKHWTNTAVHYKPTTKRQELRLSYMTYAAPYAHSSVRNSF